jgi:hypothetical protein
MCFVRKERNQQIIEILQFINPFGRMENDESTLKHTFEYKVDKYNLAEEVIAQTRMLSRVHPIIVSSLKIVYIESLKCLKTILKYSDKDLSKLGICFSKSYRGIIQILD